MKQKFKVGDIVWAVGQDCFDNYSCVKLKIDDFDGEYITYTSEVSGVTQTVAVGFTEPKNLFKTRREARIATKGIKDKSRKILQLEKEIFKLKREIDKLPQVFV